MDRGSTILPRFFLSGALNSNYLCITDGILTYTRNNHQPTTIWAEIRHRTIPHRKVTGGIITTSVENAFLLFCFTFHQVATTLRTQGTRFVHEGTAVAALRGT